MTQQYADCFVVASGFNATGSKAMAQAVISQFGDVELHHQAVVVIAVCAWLCWMLVVANQHAIKHGIEVDSVVDIECIGVLSASYLEVE